MMSFVFCGVYSFMSIRLLKTETALNYSKYLRTLNVQNLEFPIKGIPKFEKFNNVYINAFELTGSIRFITRLYEYKLSNHK